MLICLISLVESKKPVRVLYAGGSGEIDDLSAIRPNLVEGVSPEPWWAVLLESASPSLKVGEYSPEWPVKRSFPDLGELCVARATPFSELESFLATGMNDKCSRSAERWTDRLAKFLEKLMLVLQAQVLDYQFKAPQYSGSENSKYFISQFHEVAEINAWTEAVRLLHLRKAENCRQANHVEAIFDALRAWFDIFPRQAQWKLSTLRQATSATFQEHCCQVELWSGWPMVTCELCTEPTCLGSCFAAP